MKPRERECLECGVQFSSMKGDFCSTRCRLAFHNRRKTRGAELYDLYMAHRFERAEAQERRVFQAINRLASTWKQEDDQRRAGRRSWRRMTEVLAEKMYLRAVVVATNAAGNRRAR